MALLAMAARGERQMETFEQAKAVYKKEEPPCENP
jgi:hypothetical protein